MRVLKTDKYTGFTIVELLVVVVVIAIISAVTVVSYAGIQKSAQSSVTNTVVRQWGDVLAAAKIQGWNAPSTPGDEGEVCLGRPGDFPAGDGFLEGECAYRVHSSIPSVRYTVAMYQDEYFSSWPTDITRPSGRLPAASVPYGTPFNMHSRGIRFTVFGSVPTLTTRIMKWTPPVEGDCVQGEWDRHCLWTLP